MARFFLVKRTLDGGGNLLKKVVIVEMACFDMFPPSGVSDNAVPNPHREGYASHANRISVCSIAGMPTNAPR